MFWVFFYNFCKPQLRSARSRDQDRLEEHKGSAVWSWAIQINITNTFQDPYTVRTESYYSLELQGSIVQQLAHPPYKQRSESPGFDRKVSVKYININVFSFPTYNVIYNNVLSAWSTVRPVFTCFTSSKSVKLYHLHNKTST